MISITQEYKLFYTEKTAAKISVINFKTNTKTHEWKLARVVSELTMVV